MTPQTLMTLAASIGAQVAKRVFDERQSNSAKYLPGVEYDRASDQQPCTEQYLAGLCAMAAELALKRTLPAEEQAKLPAVLTGFTPSAPVEDVLAGISSPLAEKRRAMEAAGRCANCGAPEHTMDVPCVAQPAAPAPRPSRAFVSLLSSFEMLPWSERIDGQPNVGFYCHVSIGGADFHASAMPVEMRDNLQAPLDPSNEDELQALYDFEGYGPFETSKVKGLDCVVTFVPFCD